MLAPVVGTDGTRDASSDKYIGEVESGGEFFLPGAAQMYAVRIA